MTPIDEIRELYAYNRWANRRILDATAELTPDEYARDLGGSFGSVSATLRHMLGADWIWLNRWLGAAPPGFPDWEIDARADLLERWAEVEREQSTFVEGLQADDLYRMVNYRNLAGHEFTDELWRLLRHVVNHATYHRGQVVTFLRLLGRTAPSTDLIVFYRTR